MAIAKISLALLGCTEPLMRCATWIACIGIVILSITLLTPLNYMLVAAKLCGGCMIAGVLLVFAAVMTFVVGVVVGASSSQLQPE